MHNITGLSAMVLLDQYQQVVTEKALLTYDDAPDEELKNAQARVDIYTEEVHRRMSW